MPGYLRRRKGILARQAIWLIRCILFREEYFEHSVGVVVIVLPSDVDEERAVAWGGEIEPRIQ